ncbi:hypothetical protein [Cellulomonas sp. KH9]|uniref:hypothetical protein n=1 Tax=Cellulomonas sp. KH9 TaxID=1855324 RepID=UPI0008E05C11|nr:hypothetical protein [Cellulomonas sp. KH9]SFJ98783.1 hypothetical protein SAMN05216467_1564 [Cellulomonas sp. KH9]
MTPVETPLEHRAHHLAGAIYGTILATTVVAAASTHPEALGRTTVLVLGTSVVFWIAHVYAVEVAARLIAGRPLHRSELVAVARAEWPMLQSSWPILAVLLLGLVGVLDPVRAVDVAMAVGVGALFTYGIMIGRQESARWPRILLNGIAVSGLGLAVLALKVFVH